MDRGDSAAIETSRHQLLKLAKAIESKTKLFPLVFWLHLLLGNAKKVFFTA